MQKQVGHKLDIIVEGGYKICYGKRKSGGTYGWHGFGGRFTTNERLANRWAKALRNITKNY